MLKIATKGGQVARITTFSKVPTTTFSALSALAATRIFQSVSFNATNGRLQSFPILGFRSFNDAPQMNRKPRRQITAPIVLVRGLPWERHTENDVRELFQGLEIANIKILTDAATQKPTGYVFVEFSSIDETTKALRQTRNITVDDRNVFVRTTTAEEREQAVADHAKPSLVFAVRRIPYSTTEPEIRSLFEDIKIQAITVGNGVAYVRVASKEDLENAMKKTGAEFARKKIIVVGASDFDFRLAESKPPRVIRIRGAPNSSTEEDFRQFFKDIDISNVTFTTREGISGRQVPGDVFVEFNNPEDVEKALQFDRQNMGDRYLQIFRSSYKERKQKLLQQEQQQQQMPESSPEFEEPK
jgi:RNA recognition motif-containing protein